MANIKNKKAKKIKKSSGSIHFDKLTLGRSSLARRKKNSLESYDFARKTIMAVIVLAMMAVILALLVVFFLKPENAVIGKIEDMVKDYYENYYYDLVLDNLPSGKELGDAFKKYEESAFPSVSLRRLVTYDSLKHADVGEILYEYCDPDETSVKIYPTEPFSRTDYRVKYDYDACIF